MKNLKDKQKLDKIKNALPTSTKRTGTHKTIAENILDIVHKRELKEEREKLKKQNKTPKK